MNDVSNTKENFILRPEYFGGLLICRNTFTKWELDIPNMIYLWFFYHYQDTDLSIEMTNLLLENDNLIEEETLQFSLEVNSYSIPSKWICKEPNRELQFAKNMLQYLKKIDYLTAPLEMSLYITSRCQLGCDFCFMHSLIDSEKDLTFDEIKYLVDIFVDNGIESISLLGGEPLLHPDFVKICEYINEKKIHFVTTTNGLMVNENLLEKLKVFEYLSLVFSIQSIDTFNKLRTGVDSSIIMNNIRLAKEYGLSVRMNTVLTEQTYSQIEKIVDFVIQNKIERYSIGLCAENGQKLASNLEMKSVMKYKDKIEKYISLQKADNIDFAMEGCMIYSAYYNDEIFEISEFQCIDSGCQAAMSKIDIIFGGKAVPCMLLYDKNINVTDIFNKSYQEIWHNEVFNPIRTYEVESEICQECNYNIFCNGGCFANKAIKHGKFSKEADKNCFRIRGIYA